MSFKKSLVVGASFIASSFIMVPQTAFAQSAETIEEEDVITVTGSHIKRDPSRSASPLSIIDRETFEDLGIANPIDFVRSLTCLLYTSPSPRDATLSRMPSSA